MPSFEFRKSSFSGPQPDQQECVEVALNRKGTVAIRDSKDPEGPVLLFTPAAWSAFRAELAAGGLGAV